MSIDDLRFPVIAVRGPIARVYATPNDLLTCTRSALRRGWFHDLLLVDSLGNGRRVRKATRVGTVGLFWGVDIFLNQWLRVMLHFDGDSVLVSLPDLKRYLLRTVEVAPGQWDCGRSSSELRALIAGATTREELLSLMNHS
jgi:hypothetical protein